jgi:hypothetical protein
VQECPVREPEQVTVESALHVERVASTMQQLLLTPSSGAKPTRQSTEGDSSDGCASPVHEYGTEFALHVNVAEPGVHEPELPPPLAPPPPAPPFEPPGLEELPHAMVSNRIEPTKPEPNPRSPI